MLRRAFGALRERWRAAHDRAKQVIKDNKKRRLPRSFSPKGVLPSDYEPIPEDEDAWIQVGNGDVRLSEIMEYYARWYRWHPLAMDEDVSFHGPPDAAKRFWKAYEQGKAIEFYEKAHLPEDQWSRHDPFMRAACEARSDQE